MRICEICHSDKQTQIFQDVVICNNCQFAFNGNCTQEERTNYYREMEKKSFYLSHLPMPKLYLKQQKSTANFIKKHIKGTALDVGCYTGEIMTLLDRDIDGIDPSKTAVDIAKKKGLNVMLGDILEYKFNKKYDTIILSHVLEHIVDLSKFILKLSELLNDGGIIIVETPDATKFNLEKDDTFINDQKEPLLQFSYEHVNYFTPYSLKNLFTNFTISYCVHATTTIHVLRMVFRKKKDDLIKFSLLSHIGQSYDEFERIDKRLNTIDYPVYIWGLGAYTKKLLLYTGLSKLDIKGFIDDVYKDKTYMDIAVIKEPIEDIPIIIGTMQYGDYVKKLYKNYKLIEL